MTNMKKMHPEMQDKLDSIKKLIDEFKDFKKVKQQICNHLVIYETDYQSMDYCSPLYPRRICANCRVEEESKHLHHSYEELNGNNSDDSNRIFVNIDRSDFYKLRSPY